MATWHLKFLLFCLAVVFYQPALADIFVKEVRVKGNWYTKTEPILKLSPIKAKKFIPEDKLEQKMRETEKVLGNTNYFYNVMVYRLFSKKPDEATIMIEISEGFLWRFGGGPFYVTFGKENIRGEMLSCFLSTGLNLQSFELEKRFLFSQFGAGFQGLHRGYELYFSSKMTKNYWRFENLTSIFHPLPLKFKEIFRLKFGFVSNDAPYFEYFRIFGPDRLKLANFTDSIGEYYSVFTYTIRKKLLDIPMFLFPGFLDLIFFSDLGYLKKWRGISDDYGIGIGLHFPAPVFVHIEFLGAMTRNKDTKLYFTVKDQL